MVNRRRREEAAMGRVLIVGAGGVGGVVAHKCAQRPDIFGEVTLASRTLARCEKIRDQIRELQKREIAIERVDADNVSETVALLKRLKPEVLINVALPYQDLPLM